MKLNFYEIAKSLYTKRDENRAGDIIVFSHLRWEFVYQRPQHILSRLAKDRNILFIEEPIAFDDQSYGTARIITPEPHISVLQPRVSWEDMRTYLPAMAKKRMIEVGMEPSVLWFYSAAFSELIDKFPYELLVYDCMDELSAFKGASTQLRQQEQYLLKRADLVFTGGKSLYEEKSRYHSNVHCFPSSVDRTHFVKSLETQSSVPYDIVESKHPIVGFYGVIDERIDLALLSSIARRMPDVTFLMIGPVVKINKSDLPSHKNIIYLGAKSYDQLPHYLKSIDIAMMPFALNESTRFISPTKTLEFMAALKPIISTPIRDVVRDYSEVVSIAKDVTEFEKAISAYIHESKTAAIARRLRQHQIVNQTAWSKTVQKMAQLVEQKLTTGREIQSRPQYVPQFSVEGAA